MPFSRYTVAIGLRDHHEKVLWCACAAYSQCGEHIIHQWSQGIFIEKTLGRAGQDMTTKPFTILESRSRLLIKTFSGNEGPEFS